MGRQESEVGASRIQQRNSDMATRRSPVGARSDRIQYARAQGAVTLSQIARQSPLQWKRRILVSSHLHCHVSHS